MKSKLKFAFTLHSDNSYQFNKPDSGLNSTHYSRVGALFTLIFPNGFNVFLGAEGLQDYLKLNQKWRGYGYGGVAFNVFDYTKISLGLGYQSGTEEIDPDLQPVVGFLQLYWAIPLTNKKDPFYVDQHGRISGVGNKKLIRSIGELGFFVKHKKTGLGINATAIYSKYNTESGRLGGNLEFTKDFGESFRLFIGGGLEWNIQGTTQNPNDIFGRFDGGITFLFK